MAGRRDPAERRALRAEVDDPAVVLAAAARYLEARSRSVAEVRRHLLGAGYRSALVEGAIARLGELGYLDDATFAAAWVAARDRSRPRGARALRLELARKGIDEPTIRAVLAERSAPTDGDDPTGLESGGSSGSPDETAAERLLARKRTALLRGEDLRAVRQRAYALLARSGFDPDTSRVVATRFAAEAAEAAGAVSDDEVPPLHEA